MSWARWTSSRGLPKQDVDAGRIGVVRRGDGGARGGARGGRATEPARARSRRTLARRGFTLVHHVFEGWPWGEKHLRAVPAAICSLIAGASIDDARARRTSFPALGGARSVAGRSAGDRRLDESMKAMYATLPERRDSERNLITPPATRASGLGADDLARYHERVVEFFRSRLAAS